MPLIDISLEDIKICGNQLFIGGTLDMVGDSVRYGVTSIDLQSGNVNAWNPNTGDDVTYRTVNSLAVSDSTLFVGGSFNNLGLYNRKCIGAININTGAVYLDQHREGLWMGKSVNFWFPEILYMPGVDFHILGRQMMQYIACIDIQSGNVSPWNPGIVTGQSANDGIPGLNDIAIVDSTMYICGPISSVGAGNRSFLASVNMTTGLPTSWQPNPNSEVFKLIVDTLTQTVYMGGILPMLLMNHNPFLQVIPTPQ